MLFEILKNSLRATVETHGADCENFPPVKVIVAEGSDDITIKVSDEVCRLENQSKLYYDG